jgi:hypothetical protein
VNLSAGARGPYRPVWIVLMGAFTDQFFESVNHFRVDVYETRLCVQFLMIWLRSIAVSRQLLLAV